MSTLNARQQFIKNCFGEIKEQISLGISKTVSKPNPDGSKTRVYIENNFQRRSELFNRVKKELDNSGFLSAPNWLLDEVSDKEVFEAIVIFYLICDYYGNKADSIGEALDYFVGVAAYQNFPPSLQTEGAQAKTHQFIKFILAAFSVVTIKENEENEEESEEKIDNKMITLIKEYKKCFPHVVDKRGNSVSNQSGNPVYVDVAHSDQLLHFNRHIRNAVSHKGQEFEPRFRQGIATQFLYNYIIVVYILKFFLSKKNKKVRFNGDFGKYYEEHKKDYNIPVQIKDVKGPTAIMRGGVEEVLVERDGSYMLSPFTTYQFKGCKGTFDLNEYCYNATIIPPSHTKYDTIIDLPQEGVNDDLKKELEDIKKAIEDNLKKGERDAARKIVGEKLAQIEELTLVCNAIKADVEGVKEQQTKVENDLKTLLDKSKNLDEICKKINKFCEDNDSYKRLESALGKDVGEITDFVRRLKELYARYKRYVCVAAKTIVFLVFLVLSIYMYARYTTSPMLYKLEPAANLAHFCGNKDVAMYRACYLDSVKHNSWKASKCYQVAIRRYEELLQQDSTDTERASRLAMMTMRGKGGIIDTYKAEKYAHLAKRYDLEAYLAITNGDVYKASELLNNYYYERTFSDVIFSSETEFGNYDRNSSYFVLAKALKDLLYGERHHVETPEFEVIDSLSRQVGDPVRLEALLTSISLVSKGLKNSDGHYCLQPSLRYCFEQAKIASEEFNSLQAQLYLAKEYARLRVFSEVNYEEKALLNRCDPVEFGFIDDVKLRTSNPMIFIYKAKENAKKGSDEYYLTARYYHMADSLYQCSLMEPEDYFYEEWFDYIVDAHDLSSDNQILQLVNKDFPDSIREAVVDYVMALKYRRGKGVTQDMQISNERLKSAASKGLVDARVAYDVICDIDGNSEGMTDLKKLVSSDKVISELQNSYSKLNNRQGAIEENAYIHAWRYIISKGLNREEYVPEFIIPWSNLQLSRFHNGRELGRWADIDGQDFIEYAAENLEYGVSQIYKKYNNDNETDNMNYSFFIGKLAECYYLLKDTASVEFYTNIAKACLGSQAYPSFFAMSEYARKKGESSEAKKYAQLFADIYFERGYNNKRQVADDSYRVNVVSHFAHLYPEILVEVAQRTGYDFRNDIDPVQPLDENQKQSWKSPVGYMKCEKYIPDYEKSVFPVSMKYFN